LITWATDEAASSKLSYSIETLDTAVNITEVENDVFLTEHSVELLDLATSTEYFFKIQVEDVMARLEKKEIKLTLTADVYDYLAKEGYDARYGARPLKRLLQSKILTPVANNMVGEGMVQGGTVKVSMKKGELEFDIKKKGRTNLKRKAAIKSPLKKKREAVAV
jgi:hypothetical protein